MTQQEFLIILETIAKQQPSEWVPVVSALGGALVGGLVTFFPTKYLEESRSKAFSKQIQNSIIAEVSVLVRIIENRKYVESMTEAVEHLRKYPEGEFTLVADIPSHYSLIYQEQCKNIGVLDREVARNIINFYQLIDAVVQDIKPNGTFSAYAPLEAYQESLAMFQLAVEIGKNLEKL
ncbi:hypothetical protein PVK62_17240 [Aliivibrio sp. S3MY1]|uniref:hypothetical protein n=1 Tax=unclassified Aliivibrio TaxID=2645654 RepID=UPI002378B1DD|nr:MULTISPECIES: hypothetical protein [unclassified Aliivibrio]MDD9197567.1 hypothetical protein [Aliivibrio sp. S3MY1]MDD9200819.1 hypothetical protein [Aliivibrio sp. S2MY1]